jgi:putative ABC transport system permease protein
MAWRDSRRSRGRLLLFSCSIVLGIAALAAIGSLGVNLEEAIEEQTKSLLGADLVIGSRDAFTPEVEEWLRGLGGEQSREVSFTSMILLPRTDSTRLVQVRALGGGFPYYGELQTEPTNSAREFRRPGGGALVEDSLLRQFDARVGDSIRIGNLTTTIAGRLLKVPGENFALSTIAPRVYLALDDLPRTGLLKSASLAHFSAYFKFDQEIDMHALVERIRPDLEKFHLNAETVEQRKRELGRAMDNLYHFLNLTGFIALLLGGVGIASAIHVHVKQKLGTVAVLRCLGGTVAQAFAVYLVQGLVLGMAGAVMGGAVGVAVQAVLPRALADFIPFNFHFHTAWLAVARAMGIGLIICLLFTLLPLLAVRQVSPLAAIRVSFEPARARRDVWRWIVIACLAAGILGFALMQGRNWRVGTGFAVGLGVVFALLAATAQVLIRLARGLRLAGAPFAVRQGIANLHRPDNRTLLLLLSLGLVTFLMMSLVLAQRNLLNQLITSTSTGKTQPNAVLFDVQDSQDEGVTKLVRSLGLPVIEDTPVVTMRLASVKGRTVETILADPARERGGRWALRREYRSTYSDHLRDSEKLVSGQWVAQATNNPAVVPVSLETGIAQELHVGLGDELVFEVGGVPITTRVASLREVEWRRIQPNFFVVFPRGVLESAPSMHVLVTHVTSNDESARLQRDVIKAFPNVSAIDLTLVLQTVDTLLGRITFVVRFLSLFTVLTGLLVLVTSLLTGRYQRIRESVLLRTLGASRAQVFRILLVEYFLLGVLSALTGLVLSVGASWALAKFVFNTPFIVELWPLGLALLVVSAITVITGFLMSRGVLDQSPLVILRAEA